MNIFHVSDTHFGHRRILDYCPKSRGWLGDIETHDEYLIQAWNERVRPGDLVYHHGDVAFCKNAEDFLRRLHGQKHLIIGNHDRGMSHVKAAGLWRSVRDLRLVRQDKQAFVLCHFPLLVWEEKQRGAIMLHGHCHATLPAAVQAPVRRMDVGVDTRADLAPWALEEILDIMRNREDTPVDVHGRNHETR
jgi:calcineurin-like phosphoesterase family protein